MTEKLKILVYRSVATEIFDITLLDDLCRDAMIFNNEKNITGLLVYHDKRFFQWIEGAEDNIFLLYEKLKNDPRHQYLREVLYTDGAIRQFKAWGMKVLYSGMTSSENESLITFNYDELITGTDAQVVKKFISLAHHLSE